MLVKKVVSFSNTTTEEVAKKKIEYVFRKVGIQHIDFGNVNYSMTDKGVKQQIEVFYEDSQETQLDINQICSIRNQALSLQNTLKNLEEQKQKTLHQLQSIQDHGDCNHQFLVQMKPYDAKSIDNPHYCLICNKLFPDQFVTYDKSKKIIHFENVLDIPQKEKVELAFQIFKYFKEKYPLFSDAKIIELINEEIKDNFDVIKDAVSSNIQELEEKIISQTMKEQEMEISESKIDSVNITDTNQIQKKPEKNKLNNQQKQIEQPLELSDQSLLDEQEDTFDTIQYEEFEEEFESEEPESFIYKIFRKVFN